MLPTAPKSCWFRLAMFVAAMACSPAEAMDHVTLRRDGRTLYVDGRIVLKAEDGGLLFLARDGVLWRILPTELVKHHARRRAVPCLPAGANDQERSGRSAQGVQGLPDGALHDLLRHLAGLRPMVRSVVRTAIPRIPQRLEPPGL